MRDPYLYKDCDILKNKLNIKEQDLLNDAEADYVTFRLKDLALNPLKGDSLARLWKIHPFREGNTRTTVTFCCQFADEMGFPIDRKLFEDNAAYVRTALVAYNAFFSDGADFSKKEYLQRIVYDALRE